MMGRLLGVYSAILYIYSPLHNYANPNHVIRFMLTHSKLKLVLLLTYFLAAKIKQSL